MKRKQVVVDGRYTRLFKEELTKDFLIEKYVNLKMSAKEIGEEVGCSDYAVRDYLKLHGIEIHNPKEIRAGDKFNFLTVVEVVRKHKNGSLVWKCVCDCGNTTEVQTSQLKNGSIKGCKCQRQRKGQKSHNWKGHGQISGGFVTDLRWRSKHKGMDFDLDAKFIWELWLSQNGMCAISGMKIELDDTASLDRIDSSIGYVKTNVQWVHRVINIMKRDHPQYDFVLYCKAVADHNSKDKHEPVDTNTLSQ